MQFFLTFSSVLFRSLVKRVRSRVHRLHIQKASPRLIINVVIKVKDSVTVAARARNGQIPPPPGHPLQSELKNVYRLENWLWIHSQGIHLQRVNTSYVPKYEKV